eukprot:4384419-Prymnesium_polylepis.1
MLKFVEVEWGSNPRRARTAAETSPPRPPPRPLSRPCRSTRLHTAGSRRLFTPPIHQARTA